MPRTAHPHAYPFDKRAFHTWKRAQEKGNILSLPLTYIPPVNAEHMAPDNGHMERGTGNLTTADNGHLQEEKMYNKAIANKADFRDLLPQSISIAMHYLFCEIDRDKAETFFHGLVSGTKLGLTSPILKARTELIAMRKESKRAELTRAMALHFLCTAFQSYLENRRIDALPKFKEEEKIVLPRVPK